MHFSLPGRRETVEISEQRRTITRLIAGLRSCTKTESSAIVIPFQGIFISLGSATEPDANKIGEGGKSAGDKAAEERKGRLARASL